MKRWNKRNLTITIEEMEETTVEKSSGDNYFNLEGVGRRNIEGTITVLPAVLWAGTALTFLTSEVEENVTAELLTAEKIGVEWGRTALTTLERSWS